MVTHLLKVTEQKHESTPHELARCQAQQPLDLRYLVLQVIHCRVPATQRPLLVPDSAFCSKAF